MYVPFAMTFYKVVVNLNSMFLPPYVIYITVRQYNKMKGYLFPLKMTKMCQLTKMKCQNTWDIFQGKLCRLSNTKKCEVMTSFERKTYDSIFSRLVFSYQYKTYFNWETIFINHKKGLGSFFAIFSFN